MAPLKCSKTDGHYYIQRPPIPGSPGMATYQVNPEGVRYLRQHGVGVDGQGQLFVQRAGGVAHDGPKVDDRIHIRERASDNSWRPDVADNQIDALVEIGWRAVPRTVDLRIETIESLDVVSLAEQQSGAMRRDKAGAAGDQNGSRHSYSEHWLSHAFQQRVSAEGSNVLAESLLYPICASDCDG